MTEHDWLRLVYLAGLLALILPAVVMYRHRRTRLWRDIAIWAAVAGAICAAYLIVEG